MPRGSLDTVTTMAPAGWTDGWMRVVHLLADSAHAHTHRRRRARMVERAVIGAGVLFWSGGSDRLLAPCQHRGKQACANTNIQLLLNI